MPELDDPSPSLESLQSRIDTAKSQTGEEKTGELSASGRREMNKASQLASGLAGGAAVGGVCGYILDRWLGTSPIGLIIGFFVGFAAGLYNLIRQVDKEEN